MLRKSPRLLALAALAVVALGLSAPSAFAQDRGGPAQKDVTVWSGRENLQGYGDLTFGFRGDGFALMCDARSDPGDPSTFVKGSWSRKGQVVTIRFGDCVYVGRINGQVMTGTGRLTNGQTWSFSVRFVPPQQDDFLDDR